MGVSQTLHVSSHLKPLFKPLKKMGNSPAKPHVTPAQHDYLLNLYKFARQVEKHQHTNKRSRAAALELIVAVEQLSVAAASKQHVADLRLLARVVEKRISFWQRATFTHGEPPKEFLWTLSADDIFI